MILDPDDALFIENERCVQFPPVLERGGQDTNWHLVAARRADKLRPPRPRIEHGDALDRIMQDSVDGLRAIADQIAETKDVLVVGFGGQNRLQGNPIGMNIRNDENLHALTRRSFTK